MIEMRAQAQAAAIRIIAEALNGPHSDEAAKLAVAREVSLLVAIFVPFSDVSKESTNDLHTSFLSLSLTSTTFASFFHLVHRHVF